MKSSLLTGGDSSPHYLLGLLSGLLATEIQVDYIGGDATKDAKILTSQNVNFYNLRGDQNPDAPIKIKIYRVLKYYLKLILYACKTDSELFHIQWLNKFIYFDRTLLNIFYKMLGKKIVLTAHNINAAERDARDNLINRLTLKSMYNLVDNIIVHTNKMKYQLVDDFNINGKKISVIPHGILDIVPKTKLTRKQARKKLGLEDFEKILLFFGIITPYKGLEYLLLALAILIEKQSHFKLIIAGKVGKNHEEYWRKMLKLIYKYNLEEYIIKRIEYIPDEDVEIFFKASDVSILPYTQIFQSGVLFLALNFGLPTIASDVGSLKEFIIEDKAGFVCRREDPEDLAAKICGYFKSELFRNLDENRNRITNYAIERYSWEKIGEKTHAVYKSVL